MTVLSCGHAGGADFVWHYDRAGASMCLDCWMVKFEDMQYRRVALAILAKGSDHEVTVSTVWLGLDHNFSNTGPPLIFETMVWGGPLDQEKRRHATEADALAEHEAAVLSSRTDHELTHGN